MDSTYESDGSISFYSNDNENIRLNTNGSIQLLNSDEITSAYNISNIVSINSGDQSKMLVTVDAMLSIIQNGLSSTLITTTDNTPTNIENITLNDNEVTSLLIMVSGWDTSNYDTFSRTYRVVAYNDGVSATIKTNSIDILASDAGTATWDVIISVSLKDVVVDVQGENGKTIEWKVRIYTN